MRARDNSLRSGERQVAPTLDGIRADHVARYRLAAEYVTPGMPALDMGCGCGYGSHLLAVNGARVIGIDISAEAINYAAAHYASSHCIFSATDLDLLATGAGMMPLQQIITCLEVLEHIEHDAALLQWCRSALNPSRGALIVSVPNRDVYPDHRANLFHRRHYAPAEFAALLSGVGFAIERRLSQATMQTPEIVDGWAGGTLIAVCRKES